MYTQYSPNHPTISPVNSAGIIFNLTLTQLLSVSIFPLVQSMFWWFNDITEVAWMNIYIYIYLHLQNGAKFLPFTRKIGFPKEQHFFCGTAFFEIFQIILDIWFCNGDITRPNGDITRPNGDITRPHGETFFYNGVFFAKKLFFTRTTKISAFWSNGGKKYHMEDVGIYIYH